MKKRQVKKLVRHNVLKVLDAPEYLGDINIPTSVELIQYNDKECLRKTMKEHEQLNGYLQEGFVNWFKVTGIADGKYISEICKSFGLHSFDVRDLLSDARIVKVVAYDQVTFMLTSGFSLKDDEMEDIQIGFILGDNFVISFKEYPITLFDEIEKAIFENNITLRQKGADFLLYLLINAVNAFNNEFILNSEDNLLDIEDELMLQEEAVNVIHILRSQRSRHIQLKRFMLTLREEYENLLHNTNGKVKSENMVYFENLDDKFRTTSNNVENYEEFVKSLIDLYYNNNAMKMNDIMKRLTLVATIFIPLTFLVGVWGMNFANMPELRWKYGYLISWFSFIIIAIGIIVLMKKKKWF